MIRKATREDIPAIAGIYDDIQTREDAGQTTTGWLRDVYPVRQTAEDAVARGDMFVHIGVVIPKKLNKGQRELLEKLAKELGEDYANPRSPLEKLRDVFN